MLFLSFLQYVIIVGGHTDTSYTKPILKMQMRDVTAVSHRSYLAHSLLFSKELKLVMLSDIFILKVLTFVFESIYKIAFVCFHNFFSSNPSTHHYEMRQIRCKMHSIHGATLCNDLRVELRNSTLEKLKVHILNSI